MKKIQIVSRWDSSQVLYECEAPEDLESGLHMRHALENAVRCGTNLRGANLGGAYLHGARLRGANLGDADLRDTNLRDTNLRGAYLRSADLRVALQHGEDRKQGEDIDAAIDAAKDGVKPYAWAIAGCGDLFTGEFAEDEARAEARRVGGDCKAFPLYLAPSAPALTPLTMDEYEAAAHIYPSDIKKFEFGEHTATAFSIPVGCPDERSVPVYTLEQINEALEARHRGIKATSGGSESASESEVHERYSGPEFGPITRYLMENAPYESNRARRSRRKKESRND